MPQKGPAVQLIHNQQAKQDDRRQPDRKRQTPREDDCRNDDVKYVEQEEWIRHAAGEM